MIKKILIFIGFLPDKYEQIRIDKIKNRDYKTMRVVGRGTIKIDPKEISELNNKCKRK